MSRVIIDNPSILLPQGSTVISTKVNGARTLVKYRTPSGNIMVKSVNTNTDKHSMVAPLIATGNIFDFTGGGFTGESSPGAGSYASSGSNTSSSQSSAEQIANQTKETNDSATSQNTDTNQARQNSTTSVNPNNTPQNNQGDDNTENSEQDNASPGQTETPEVTETLVAWDPRLARSDQFILENTRVNSADKAVVSNIVIPFASDTAASCFYDQVFSAEKGVADIISRKRGGQGFAKSGSDDTGTTMVPIDAESVAQESAFYGVQSLMNPYSITKLVGGLGSVSPGKKAGNNYMYDIRDQRRFYDIYNDGESGTLSISEPTTTNIVLWSNRDKWGRTPYSFQDFCFCKWWKIIPNNRLLTLRKYHAPTFDNLNFDGMYENTGTMKEPSQPTDTPFAPICTVVSYFGEETGNQLSELLSFTAGTPWEEIESKVHDVDGDEGDNPDTFIDELFKNGGGFGNAEHPLVNKIMHMANVGVGKMQSFGSFLALSAGVYDEKGENVNKLSEANMDPYRNGPYNNRIIGPVNRIDKIKKRKEGLEFSQELSLTCEYVARNIGGINPKAVMLDIFANCMEMATQDAVFWGGGYRFNIKPQIYPWKSKNEGHQTIRGIMQALYKGEIFGSDGAISRALNGVKKVGASDANQGTFSMDALMANVKDKFGVALGAIGAAINSVSQAVFGKTFELVDDVMSGAGVTDDQKSRGQKVVETMATNLENMFRSRIIQKTIYPTVNGMQALLIGLPVGNWHLTIGNPLNPIAVIGNLICEKVQVKWGEELGPDDFPLELKVTYTLSHGMMRDKAGIQSMFNRGCGRIYSLPDYIRASSDTGETKVDIYTGGTDGNAVTFREPAYITTASLNAHGLQKYDVPAGKIPSNSGTGMTVPVPKFTPFGTDNVTSRTEENYSFIQNNSNYYTISVVRAHKNARKFLT